MKTFFRSHHLLLITLLMSMLPGTFALAQEDMTAVTDSAFAERIRPRAVFNHDAHNEAAGLEDCAVCHHVYEDGVLQEDESSEDSQCSECHGESTDKRNLSLVKAFHNRCKGCHEEEKKGPVVCSECHQKP